MRALEPRADPWHWQTAAHCRGHDVSVFFGSDGEDRRGRQAREARAKMTCAQCVVIRQCREHAMQIGEKFGVWGGLSPAERAKTPVGRFRRD
ncbi:WhiB family transcriptional regulator [Mycolicibacterium sp. Y3]